MSSDAVLPQPGRDTNIAAAERLKPQRSMTSLPSQTLDLDSTIEVLSRPSTSDVSRAPTLESESVDLISAPGMQSQKQGLVKVVGDASLALDWPSTAAATPASLTLESSSIPAESGPSEPLTADVRSLVQAPLQTHLQMEGSEKVSTSPPNEVIEEAPAAQMMPALASVGLDGTSEVAYEHHDLHGLPLEPAGPIVNTEPFNRLLTEISALKDKLRVTEDSDTNSNALQQTMPAPTQDPAPPATSPDVIVLADSNDPQPVPPSDKLGPTALPGPDIGRSTHITPPAEGRGSEQSRKRPADDILYNERISRPRVSPDMPDNLHIQLPTPTDSPVATNTTTLSKDFESRLTETLRRPQTMDLKPIINAVRIQLMREACRRDDRFYILTHAIFCLFSPAQRAILKSLLFVEQHFQGLQILVSLLGSNRRLTSELFAFFVGFPRPPEELTRDRSDTFQVLLEEVRCFLFHLGAGISRLRLASAQRGFPPCSAELKFSLKLPSPILQKSLFNYLLLQTSNDPGWISLALSLFDNDMNDPAGSAVSISVLNAYHGAQLPAIVQRWGFQYKQIWTKHKALGSTTLNNTSQEPLPGHVPIQLPLPPRPVSGTTTASLQNLQRPTPPTVPLTSLPPQTLANPSQVQMGPSVPSNHPQPAQHAARRNLSLNSPELHQAAHFSTPPMLNEPLVRQPPSQFAFSDGQHSPAASPQMIHTFGPPRVANTIAAPPVQTVPSSQGVSLPPSRSADGSVGEWLSPVLSCHLTEGKIGHDWLEVEKIFDKRTHHKAVEYFVRWKGDSSQRAYWLPKGHMRSAPGGILVGWRGGIRGDVQHLQQRGTHNVLSPSQQTQQPEQPILNVASAPATLHQHLPSQGPPSQSAISRETTQQLRSQQVPITGQSRHISPFPSLLMSQTPTQARAPDAPPIFVQRRRNDQRIPSLPRTDQESGPTMGDAGNQQQAVSHVQAQTAQHATPPLGQLLFHRDANYNMPQIAVPEPWKYALHQAGLASPKYNTMADLDGAATDARHYQFVEEIIELSQFVTKDSDLIRWKIRISSELWYRRTITLPALGELSARQRNVANGNTQFRLKSIVLGGDEGQAAPTLSDFCSQPTHWPKFLSVTVNGDEGVVDFRRKAHWGVDLPADVTELLQEGDNEIMIGAVFTSQEANLRFLMAIEIINVASHDRLLQMPRRIPATEARAAITSLLKKSDDGDDDIIVDQPGLSIDLVDPFMSVIWVTPVRGEACAHRECFDLEAFLLSRTSREKDGSLTNPDKWHCPICKSDCRPPMLVVDEFLLEVRQTLARTDQLHIKAILVNEDGSWEPRFEQSATDTGRHMPDRGTPSTGMPDQAMRTVTPSTAGNAVAPEVSAFRVPSPPRPPRDQTEVIVIEDDDD